MHVIRTFFKKTIFSLFTFIVRFTIGKSLLNWLYYRVFHRSMERIYLHLQCPRNHDFEWKVKLLNRGLVQALLELKYHYWRDLRMRYISDLKLKRTSDYLFVFDDSLAWNLNNKLFEK